MNDVTKDLLVRLRVLLSLHDARVDTADAWNLSMEEARSAIARAEAALAEPQPDADGWIPWAGGDEPVGRDTPVDLRYRDSEKWPDKLGVPSGYCHLESSYPYWRNDGGSSDIIAYRIVRK